MTQSRANHPGPMHDSAAEVGAPSSARLEMVMQQIDALPTLSAVATRVLALSGSSESDVREITRLISGDPALTVKILALCRRAERGLGSRITTVDRAVVMLGLNAVRSAMLSVEVCGLVGSMIEENETAEGAPAARPFDRRELWRHSVAVACAAELIAAAHPGLSPALDPSEAFVCGLLHDLGKLALDRVLPRTYARVAELCESRQGDIADYERRVIGLDHHTAGKRLAENWGLPHLLQDVLWLHGHAPSMLPALPHRGMVALVSVGDALVRELHVGWSGNHQPPALDEHCAQAGLDVRAVRGVTHDLLDRVRQRAADLGLEEEEDRDLLLKAVGRANQRLGRLSLLLDEQSQRTGRDTSVVEAIARFNAGARRQTGLLGVMGEVARSARAALGDGPLAMLWMPRAEGPSHLFRFGPDGAVEQAHESGGDNAAHCAKMFESVECGAEASTIPMWCVPLLGWPAAGAAPRALHLTAQGWPAAALLHACPPVGGTLGARGAEAITSAWGWALTAAAQHQGARRLGERVAEANRLLAETQARLLEARSLARAGEIAAGAAHEMNNPLAVISGQCQLLAGARSESEMQDGLRAIEEASEKLSGLISSMHELSSRAQPARCDMPVESILDLALTSAREIMASERLLEGVRLRTVLEQPGLLAHVDAEQIGRALTELIINAAQASPRSGVEIRAHIDPLDDRLLFTVSDDGVGMTSRTLAHAFDPFFSERRAGRRRGLGLARARRWVDAHGGEIVLDSHEGQGTKASIILPRWRAASTAARAA